MRRGAQLVLWHKWALYQIPDCHRDDDDEEPALPDFVTEIQETKRVVSFAEFMGRICQLQHGYPHRQLRLITLTAKCLLGI